MLRVETTTTSITVGTNPFLKAEYVDKFRAHFDASRNIEIIKYRTLPNYAYDAELRDLRQTTEPTDVEMELEYPQQ